jgi:hypothetical protein
VFDILAVELPRTLHFLQPGWFVLHIISIPLVFVLGMAVARRGLAPGTGYGRAP